MQEEKDYIQREIKKIISFLKRFIGKVSKDSLEENDLNFSKDFFGFFGFDFSYFINLDEEDFRKKSTKIDSSILEQLVYLFLELAKKNSLPIYAEKGLILLEIIDKKEKIFSLERMQLKQSLKQIVSRET